MTAKPVLTFDCFGTLVDWEAGIWSAFQPLLRRAGSAVSRDEALTWYAAAEVEAERGGYRPYRAILTDVLRRIGARVGRPPTPDEEEAFVSSIAGWPLFADTKEALRALARRYRLAVVTNCDDDLFAAVAARQGLAFDEVVTAQQARSYKPSARNFALATERLGVQPRDVTHVACSLFHDCAPAKELGFTTVWINRRHGERGAGATPEVGASVKPDFTFFDLRSFVPFALDRLAPRTLE